MGRKAAAGADGKNPAGRASPRRAVGAAPRQRGGLKPDRAAAPRQRGGLKPDRAAAPGAAGRGRYDARNALNDLTDREWASFTRSWFVHSPPRRSRAEMLHPAKYPESMAEEFVRFFTKRGGTVLDPMVGTGSTLVACDRAGRRGVGVELTEKWAAIARGRTAQRVITGDARDLGRLLAENGVGEVDYCITSPPYWNMLRKSRGGVESAAKARKKRGLDAAYSDSPDDLGNMGGYEEYLDALAGVYSQVRDALREGGHLTVVCQNVLTAGGAMAPLAWDVAKRLGGMFRLRQERIWAQDNKRLGVWGYPFRYVSNVHHHYCLVFQKGGA